MTKLTTRIRQILFWSQRYTHTDMLYVARGGFWLNLKQLSALAFSLVTAIAFANLVPKEVYGTYRFVLSLGGILGALTLSGMNTAVTRAVAQGYEGTFVRSLVVQARWAWVTVVASFATALYYFINGNPILGSAFIAFGILYPIYTVSNTYLAFLQGKKDFSRTFWYGLGTSAFQFAGIIGVILLIPNVVYLVVAYYATQAAANGFYLYRTLRVYRPSDKSDGSALGYGKHLSLMNLLGSVASQIDGILVFHFLGPTQLAIYSFATLVPERIRGLFKFTGTIALPRFSENDSSSAAESVAPKTARLAVAAIIVAGLYIIFAPLGFQLVIPKYVGAIPYSQVYAISLVALASYIPLAALMAQANRKLLYQASTISSVVQIVLISTGLFWWGLWGAIIAKVVMQFFGLIYLMILIRTRTVTG